MELIKSWEGVMVMDMNYDKIQAALGGVGDSFSSNIRKLFVVSNLDVESELVLKKICKETENSLNEICILISHSMQLKEK